MTNEQMIVEYQQTKSKALLDQIYNKNQGLIYSLQHKYKCDIDLIYIAFMTAVNRLDPNKSKFTTFLMLCARNEVLMDRRKIRPTTESMDNKIDDKTTYNDVISDNIDREKQAEYKDICRKALKTLKNDDRKFIIDYFYKGIKQKDIARLYNTHQPKIARRIEKGLKQLKGVIKEI